MTNVKHRLEQAQRQAIAAGARVEAISAKRLAQLKKLPAKAAARYLNDPRLTAKDRETLQRALVKGRPRRLPQASRSLRLMPDAVKWLQRHPRLTLSTVGVFLLVLMAFQNTPRTIGIGRMAYDLEVIWPDGTVQPLPLGETYAVVGATENEWQVRVWRPGMNYELLLLPRDALHGAR